MHYDPESDILILTPQPAPAPEHEMAAEDLTLVTRADGTLVELRIAHPGRLIANALQAGVPLPAETGTIWYDARSSMIRAFGYDEATRTLDVVFRYKGFYRYREVPPHIVAGLRAAPSKGRYMRQMIINRYPTERSR